MSISTRVPQTRHNNVDKLLFIRVLYLTDFPVPTRISNCESLSTNFPHIFTRRFSYRCFPPSCSNAGIACLRQHWYFPRTEKGK